MRRCRITGIMGAWVFRRHKGPKGLDLSLEKKTPFPRHPGVSEFFRSENMPPTLNLLMVGAALATGLGVSAAPPDHVILLHGLARTSSSMERMAASLRLAGYVVHNIDYPSRTARIGELA